MTARPLRLGLALGGLDARDGWERAFARAARAEALGFHSLWLPEAHFAPGATPSPLVALAAFAARTERIRLGTTSLLLPVRPAAQVAEEVATLDRLSGGRVWPDAGVWRGSRGLGETRYSVAPGGAGRRRLQMQKANPD